MVETLVPGSPDLPQQTKTHSFSAEPSVPVLSEIGRRIKEVSLASTREASEKRHQARVEVLRKAQESGVLVFTSHIEVQP